MRMPKEFVARMRTDGRVSSSDSLLVSLELFWHGQPYYEDILGMTDAAGEAKLTRNELSTHFANEPPRDCRRLR